MGEISGFVEPFATFFKSSKTKVWLTGGKREEKSSHSLGW